MARKTDWSRVGGRVRRLRNSRGLTQGEVAGRRITTPALSMIESGKRRPSPDVLSYLADRLGTTEDYLLTGRDPGIETRLRLDTERARLAVHQGRAAAVLPELAGIIERARRADLSEIEADALEVIGLAHYRRGEFEEGLEAYDAATELWSADPVERQVGARCGRARGLYLMGDVHYAVHVLEVLLAELRRSVAPDPTAMAKVYSALVGPYFKSGLIEKARAAVEESHRLSLRVPEPEVVGCMYVNLAGVCLGDERVDDAIEALVKAAECFAGLEWSDELATTKIAQAMGFIEKEEWSDAREQLLSALEVLHDVPDPTSRATALNQLGRVERAMGDIDAAEKHLTDALDLVASGNLNERGLAQRELALCALVKGDEELARELLLQAVDSYRTASNALQVARTFKLFGDLASERGDHEESLGLYREGLEAATAAAL